jgi:hypothetical protein
MPLAAPPSGGALEVRLFTWVEQRPITRVCTASHQPNDFNPSDAPGRFRPFYCGDVQPVPTMYGSTSIDGALGETVFHDVPAGDENWSMPRASLYARLRTVLIPQRALKLVDLTGWAHKALKIDGRALVECDPHDYPVTALWAERFHDVAEAPDGLYWRSRQYDKSFGLMLFGDRVNTSELRVVFDETVGLWQGDGLDEVLAAAERANITIVK